MWVVRRLKEGELYAVGAGAPGDAGLVAEGYVEAEGNGGLTGYALSDGAAGEGGGVVDAG